MPKQKYFTQRLSERARELLHGNPDAFYVQQHHILTRIVYEDMDLLATLVIPVRVIEYHSNPYETWHEYHNWYNINQDKKDTVLDMFSAYYGACGIGVPNKRLSVWTGHNKTYAESLAEFKEYGKSKDLVFDCLRAIYFYNNYDNQEKWLMKIPYNDRIYNERIYKNGQIWIRDFVDTDYSNHEPVVYKMRYSKQDLLYNQIYRLCDKIASRGIAVEKSRVAQEKREIENAYAVLRKHGLLPAKSTQNQRS